MTRTSVISKHWRLGGLLAVIVLAVICSPAWSQAKTGTGFYYPTGRIVTNYNWNACGAAYFTNERHIGNDILEPIGTSIRAISLGTVVSKSGPDQSSGWGIGNYALAIKHTATTGDFIAIYGHIHTSLNVGNVVQPNVEIGTVGKYYEIVNGKEVDYASHLHFGVHPDPTVPSSGWGRIQDVGCAHPSSTNGFVDPLDWITTRTPAGGTPPCTPDPSNLWVQFGVGGSHCGTPENPFDTLSAAFGVNGNPLTITIKNNGNIGTGTLDPGGKTVTLKPQDGQAITLSP